MGNELISEREFEEVWGVYVKSSGDLFWYEDVKDKELNHVWSIVESGDESDGNWYAEPGLHVVNLLGYAMTKRPWIDSTPDAIYFLDDFEHDEGEQYNL